MNTPIPQVISARPGDDKAALLRLQGFPEELIPAVLALSAWREQAPNRAGFIVLVEILDSGENTVRFGSSGMRCIHEAVLLLHSAATRVECEHD